jgi:hypothetical protein
MKLPKTPWSGANKWKYCAFCEESTILTGCVDDTSMNIRYGGICEIIVQFSDRSFICIPIQKCLENPPPPPPRIIPWLFLSIRIIILLRMLIACLLYIWLHAQLLYKMLCINVYCIESYLVIFITCTCTTIKFCLYSKVDIIYAYPQFHSHYKS